MSLKKSKGNMYPWISHMHTHLGGRCSHECSYCYVQSAIYRRNPSFIERYTGDIKLIEKEFDTNYGKGKTIFIEHCNDLFAKDVPDEFIERILDHCRRFPQNIYVFQTKNPARFFNFLHSMPIRDVILGTTIETNRDMSNISKAPPAVERYEAMKALIGDKVARFEKFRKFLTCEPILDFDVEEFARWIGEIKPDFFNIGADSKGHNLIEPPHAKILELVEELKKYGIEVREKHNMQGLIERQKNGKVN